ncbi:MAG: enoyl-CoA hydratase/isomerase family protein [Actinomycetota bacterium]
MPQGLVLESLTYSTLQSGPEFATWLDARGPKDVPPDVEPPILVERDGTAIHVVLNRPARANAFIAPMRDALVEALRTAAADPSIEGVILRGVGASFCSGGDLAEFGSVPDPAIGHATRVTRSPAWWVDHLARDVRVHLHGHCVGAGIELPAFAGTVLAAEDTRIRLPEVAMGLVPGAGGTVSIPRRIGRHRTAWLAVTGTEINAVTALRWGLIDRVE